MDTNDQSQEVLGDKRFHGICKPVKWDNHKESVLLVPIRHYRLLEAMSYRILFLSKERVTTIHR